MPNRTAQAGEPGSDRRWVLVVYRAPKEPSTARVAAWRRLHRMGGLYIGPSVCLLPAALAKQTAVDQVAEGVRSAGGSFDALIVESFAPEAHELLIDRFSAARDAEYAELVERAQALEAELERERGRGKCTFAEVEENEADMARLQRWLKTVVERDLFGAPGRVGAELALRQAEDALRRFVEQSARLEEEASS